MGEYACAPWRRYGHDRVYVSRAGDRLGYLDRATGQVVADEAVAADVRAALVAEGFLAAPVPALEWAITLPGDTATYRPGASARAMAQAEREAAPVRTALARALGVHTDERAWRVGAEGEEAVARRLSRLPDAWTVVHDLPIGNGANVDHLVVGPGGVFTLNTKNLSGAVWVGGDAFLHNGHREPYVAKARAEARRVAGVLTGASDHAVTVHGVVVVIAEDMTVKAPPRDVAVVTHHAVRHWLAKRPAVLDAATVARLARTVRDPRTWRALTRAVSLHGERPRRPQNETRPREV